MQGKDLSKKKMRWNCFCDDKIINNDNNYSFISGIAKLAGAVNGKMNGACAPPLIAPGNQRADSKECCPPLTMFKTEYQPSTSGQ